MILVNSSFNVVIKRNIYFNYKVERIYNDMVWESY